MTRLGFAIGIACFVGCAEPLSPVLGPAPALRGVDGRSYDVRAISHRSEATVVTFFSASCPCQRAHDERLRALYRDYAPRGVAFIAVDSEAGSSLERDAPEAKRRRYPFPLVLDPDARLAGALGALYATYTVVLDRDGRIRYRGGLDSDMHVLRDDARLWVREALDRVLAGADPDPAHTKALGCTLRVR